MMLCCLLLFFMNWEASSSCVPLSSLIHHQIQDDTYLSVQTYDDQSHPISTPYGIISYVNHYFAILEVDLNAIASYLNMLVSLVVNGSESFSNSFSYLYDAFENQKQKVLYDSSQPIEK